MVVIARQVAKSFGAKITLEFYSIEISHFEVEGTSLVYVVFLNRNIHIRGGG